MKLDLSDAIAAVHAADPEMTEQLEDNVKRAAWAEAAIKTFRKVTRTDREDALMDLLANLMHWADRENADFDCELARARTHYEAELRGE